MELTGNQTKMWWLARGFAFTSWIFVGAVMLTTHANSADFGFSTTGQAPVEQAAK